MKKLFKVVPLGMQVIVDYTEEEVTALPEDFFQSIAEETLRRSDISSIGKKKKISLTAVSVSREKIQELNATYRGKDKVTDILSFGEYADTVALEGDTADEIFLGELFFCKSFIEDAAREDGITFPHEMAYIFSHGILHLLGYDHSEKMFAIQDAVTEDFVTASKN